MRKVQPSLRRQRHVKVKVTTVHRGEVAGFILRTLPWCVAVLKKMSRQWDDSRL